MNGPTNFSLSYADIHRIEELMDIGWKANQIHSYMPFDSRDGELFHAIHLIKELLKRQGSEGRVSLQDLKTC